MTLSDLIAEHGDWIYAIAFIWAFFEGETFVLFGGLAAAQGVLDPLILFFSVAIGSFCGDQCWFQLGRRFGPVLLRRFERWRSRVVAPLAWLERYDAWFILSFRFIYGIRNISSFAIGLSAVAWRRFSALNLLGSALWARASSLSAISSAACSASRSAISRKISRFSCSRVASSPLSGRVFPVYVW
jgi:membrane protein DedA with SNARE-associated domain